MIEPLDAEAYRPIVRRALEEDLGGRLAADADITTAAIVDPSRRARGAFLVKAPCVVAGLAVAVEAFRLLEPSVQESCRARDGESVQPGDVIAEIVGTARALLAGERTALNLLQRLSGIATRTHAFVRAAAGRIVVLDTRKTSPTLRVLERYAVRAGGGTNHRAGLADAILIKDNHVRLAGGVRAAVDALRAAHPHRPIEVEAQSFDEIDEAVAAGAETILVDNFSADEVGRAVARIARRARTEISGGVTLDQMAALAASGADSVSVGALTHSAPAVDISFEIESL